MNFMLWQATNDDDAERCDLGGPLALSLEGVIPAALVEGGAAAPHAVLLGVSRQAQAIAALVVPPQCEPAVRHNGVRLASGAQLLFHADRLDFGEHTIWVARDNRTTEIAYEPTTHGENVFCARTKARLKAGDQVVVCPGAGCGLIYKAEAWQLRIRCHHCGFDPNAAAWRPLVLKRRTYHELLNLSQLA